MKSLDSNKKKAGIIGSIVLPKESPQPIEK
jgi:hypothetical protein